MTTRRQFIAAIPAGAVALALARSASAAATLEESDPAAAALGYHKDGSKVDAKKWPTYKAEHHCGNCALFQGKPTDAEAPCGAFGGKLVANKGWCAAWSKKA